MSEQGDYGEILTADELIEAIGPVRWAALKRKMVRACRSLQDVLYEVKAIQPDASLYLDGTHILNLMSGRSHDMQAVDRQERTMYHCWFPASGGDW